MDIEQENIILKLYEDYENEKEISPQLQLLQKKFTNQRAKLDRQLRKAQKHQLQKLIETTYEIRQQENKEYLHEGLKIGIKLAIDIYS